MINAMYNFGLHTWHISLTLINIKLTWCGGNWIITCVTVTKHRKAVVFTINGMFLSAITFIIRVHVGGLTPRSALC